MLIILGSVNSFSQTKTTDTNPSLPTVFDSTSISFNLTPITLPRQANTLSGMETDALVHFNSNLVFGPTTLISTSPFVGGRLEYSFNSIAKYLENHTSLTGSHFQAGLTFSLGVVKANVPHYGERAGIFLKYAPNGSDNFDMGIDVEWNNLPGIAHNIPSIAVGPAFRF